jgi:replicative DNA helicase
MSFNAESAVLGACLLDAQAYWRVADVVHADDFVEPDHRKLFQHIAELRKAGVDADVITIAERSPVLASLVLDIANNTPSSKNARAYAELVAAAAEVRRVQMAGRQIAGMEGKGILSDAQRLLAGCMRATLAGVRKAGEVFREMHRSIIERSLADDSLTGIATGFFALDEMTAGLQAGELIVIAARPSVGKTALLVQLATTASRAKKRVLIVSIEMSSRSILERFASHIGQIDSMHIRRPRRMTDDESRGLSSANVEIESLPIYIDDKVRTVEGISAIAHQMHATDGLDLLGIDYLQLMHMPRAENTNEAIQIITRELKGLAKDLNIPVVALSQLTREGEERPRLSHLRGSGSIEQDVDLAVLMSRPDKKRRDVVMLDVAKQRNGPVGEIYLDSDLARNTFSASDYAPPSRKAKADDGFGEEERFSDRYGGGKRAT